MRLANASIATCPLADVRLTMGGEPTFVSIDDMDGAEWNTASLGPQKRARAGLLVRRLRKQFAPGSVLHCGQGKWYPGESLPRWALGCWWRRDGVPVWNEDCLLADDAVDYGHGEEHAKRFITALASQLEVDASHVIPAYEDAWYYMWRERRLPVNVDPLESQLSDEEERARLARVFEQGLDHVVGYVLPLRRQWTSNPGWHWESGRWLVRPEHLFLIPGDSADWLSSAARFAAMGDSRRLPLRLRAGSPRRSPAVAPAADVRGPRVSGSSRTIASDRNVARVTGSRRGHPRAASPIPA